MTEQLPIPLSRADCYLATAAGMTGVILPADGPQGREEDYLAYMAGDTTIVLPTPGPLKEQWLAIICGDTSVTTPEIKGAFLIGQQMVRVEFLAKAAGVEGVVLPTNPNRTEQYFANIGGIVPDPGVLTQAKGTYIVLNNVLRGINSLDYIYGDTYQQTYSGKNLVYTSPRTYNGITWSYDSDTGVTSFSGTPTVHYSFSAKVSENLPAGDYTMSINEPKNYRIEIGFYDSNNVRTSVYLLEGYTSKSFTLSEDMTGYDITASRLTVDTFISDSFQIQLEKGDVPSPSFEPYCGGIPSPNPDYPQDIQVVTGEQTVNVHGKNLFNKSLYIGSYQASYTELSDGVKVTTTVGGNSAAYASIKIPNSDWLLGKTVYLKIGDKIASNNGSTKVVVYQSRGATSVYGSPIALIDGATKEATFTFPASYDEGNNCFAILFYCNSANIGDYTYYKDIQLELGSTPTTYEPYQSQSYKINLGKNLFDKDNATLLEAYFDGQHTSLTGASTNRTAYLKVKPNTTYTISKLLSVRNFIGTTQTEPTVGTSVSNIASIGNGNYDGVTRVSGTLTTGSNDNYIVINYTNTNAETGDIPTNILNSIQIEEGSIATPFAPYFTPIELCKIGTYQDYIYKSGGDWYVHKALNKLVLNGTESWTATGGGNGYRIEQNDIVLTPASENAPVLCDYFTITTFSDIYNGRIDYGIANHNSNHWIVLRDKNWTSATDATTWLSAHNITVYYALATPTDIKITDATLISELEAVGSAVLPTPDAFIQVAGNLAGEIEISYYAKSEE